jgi:outer membrane lipopolysaccharide assembly protein LptE/RlpB
LSFFEDTKGNLWLGTGLSLNRYDPVNNQFVTYSLSLPAQSPENASVYNKAETSERRLYLAISYGLAIVNDESKQFSLLADVNSKLVSKQ